MFQGLTWWFFISILTTFSFYILNGADLSIQKHVFGNFSTRSTSDVRAKHFSTYQKGREYVTQGQENTSNISLNDLLSTFSEEILKLDNGHVTKYVQPHFQAKTRSSSTVDRAAFPLLEVDEKVFYNHIISKFQKLYDNYSFNLTVRENVTNNELQEQSDFLDALISLPIMKYTQAFLYKYGNIKNEIQDFKMYLNNIWFRMYKRGGHKLNSSGFEHVFFGEINKNIVSGLHNWLRFYEEEKRNAVNYLGYMKYIDLGLNRFILQHHFTFYNVDKPVGTMFIGTSPEFEIALYTACFVLMENNKPCPVMLANNRVTIQTYVFNQSNKKMVGSAFPNI